MDGLETRFELSLMRSSTVARFGTVCMKLRELDELKAMWTELSFIRPVFNSRTVHEGIIVQKVKTGDFFLEILRFFPSISIESTVATYSYTIILTTKGGYNTPT
jgi:hypothetical protein